MKLSTRSRYGVRFMFELALNYGKEPILLKEIAKKQDISEKYLSKIVIPLKGAGLINAQRGSHGGYIIAREPSKISLKEVVDILEGDTSFVECVKNENICSRTDLCPTRDIWCRMDREISRLLKSISMEDIVNDYRDRRKGAPLEYYI